MLRLGLINIRITSKLDSPVKAVGNMSRLAFGSRHVQFLGRAHSFTTYQLLVKG